MTSADYAMYRPGPPDSFYDIVLKHNPQWSAADWPGVVSTTHDWAEGKVVLRGMFFYDVEVPFTRESWRGRFRACRGVGAGLTPEEVAAFWVLLLTLAL